MGKLFDQQLAYDQLINAEVQLQLKDEMVLSKVKQRALGPDGTTVGMYSKNPYLNLVYQLVMQ